MRKTIRTTFMAAIITGTVILSMTFTGCEKKSAKVSAESSSTESKALQRIKKAGVWKIGSSGDVYAYIDQKTGEFSGIDAEICKAVAEKLGIPKVEMVLIPFSELILNLNNGNIDMIADGMYTTAVRAKQIYYGDIWYTQGAALMIPESSSIKNENDFDPKKTRVGYTAGTIWQKEVENWVKQGLIKEAVSTGLQADSLVALQYGKVDAFLTDYPAIEELVAKAPEQLNGLKFAPEFKDKPETLGHIAPSVKFADKDFMEEVNKAVYELRAEGKLEPMFRKCFLDPAHYMITNSEEDRANGVNIQ